MQITVDKINHMKIEIQIETYDQKEILSFIKVCCKNVFLIMSTTNKEQYNQYKSNNTYENIIFMYRNSYKEIHLDKLLILDKYSCLINKVLNDENTSLFYDRHGLFKEYGSGINNFYRNISNIVIEYLSFYSECMPDYIYSKNIPHEIKAWIRCNVAEYLGIKVLTIEDRPLPYFFYLVKGFKKERKICIIDNSYCSENLIEKNKYIDDYVYRTQSEYSIGIPYYEKDKILKNGSKYYNLYADLLSSWKRLDLVFNKYICYKTYQKIAIIPDLTIKYIIYFMHYQPEQTSLPEAFGFTQQIIAINTLRIATPRNIEIFVKEHPATFTYRCYPSQRHPSFYEDINIIDGVSLVNIDIDSYSLIDSSIATASLTGTVGVESLIRGKPVIYFGAQLINNQIGVHYFISIKNLREFINSCIICINKEIIQKEIIKYLKKSVEYSIPLNKKVLLNDRINDTDRYCNDLKIKIIKLLISGKIQIPI